MLDKDWRTIFERIRNGELNDIYSWFYRQYFSRRNHSGFDVMDQDRDYLIILDACRYDMFEEVNWIGGELKKVRSKGSTSVEFMNRNYTDYYYNTVYVSANPFMSPHPSSANFQREPFNSEEHFPHVNMVFMEDKHDLGGVASPEGVTEEALKTKQRYPDSKMIVHYMQPHKPFIADHELLEGVDEDLPDYQDLRDSGLTWKQIREIYKANLERVLHSVENLIEELDGKIVITADHGEMLGEYRLHSHPAGVYFDELVDVPWFEVGN